jgi:hypothetical protein
MASKKTSKAIRSPVTAKVFDALIQDLRNAPEFDEATCDRLEEALTSGQTINAANLGQAMFPKTSENKA